MTKLKDDTEEITKETQNIKNEVSLAREILKNYKFYNQTLQILLLVSVLTNILIVMMLK